LAQNSIAQLEV